MNRFLQSSVFLPVLTLASAQSRAQDMPRISRIIMAQQVDSSPAAIYPEDARAAGIQGTVTLDVVVSATGKVEQVHALSGPYKLREAAKQAVAKWTYKPYRIDEVAKEVDTTVLLEFSLRDGGTTRDASGDAVETMAESSGAPPAGAVSRGNTPTMAGPTRVSSGVMAGNKLSGRPPVYPAEAKAEGITGSVVMRAVISKQGTIDSLEVLSGPSQLRQAAIDCVKTWTYKPFELNGQPNGVLTTITINFNITGR